MATPTYVPLATITLSATDSEISFSSIPATYRDLIFVVKPVGTAAFNVLRAEFNDNVGGGAYLGVEMYGTGSATQSSTFTRTVLEFGFTTSSTNCQYVFQIMDYSATDKHKTVLARGDDAAFRVDARALRWENTSAINKVDISSSNASFASGTTISLYGIA